MGQLCGSKEIRRHREFTFQIFQRPWSGLRGVFGKLTAPQTHHIDMQIVQAVTLTLQVDAVMPGRKGWWNQSTVSRSTQSSW